MLVSMLVGQLTCTGSDLAAGDLQQFLGDIALAQLVVFEGQVLDQSRLALSVAFFMATIRALCSLALAFSKTW